MTGKCNQIGNFSVIPKVIWSNFKGFISFLLSNIKFPYIYSNFWTKVLSTTKWIVGPLRRASRSKMPTTLIPNSCYIRNSRVITIKLFSCVLLLSIAFKISFFIYRLGPNWGNTQQQLYLSFRNNLWTPNCSKWSQLLLVMWWRWHCPLFWPSC